MARWPADCIEGALGHEIVQSLFPLEIQLIDTVVANGLHGALYVGARHAVAPRKADWLGD
jgi:2-oxo-3-hexenedioate decarboxylase